MVHSSRLSSEPSDRRSFKPSSKPSSGPSPESSTEPSSNPSSFPSSEPSAFGCVDYPPCNGYVDKFPMCMYDRSADKIKDKCQTVDQFEHGLEKGDELVKCGACYGDFNIFTRPDNINQCSDDSIGMVPCGADKRTGEMKYPICMWDASKKEPKSKCETASKHESHLSKQSKKSQGDMLLDCGFCSELNLFEGYGWEPSSVPPVKIEGGCDWEMMDVCRNDGSEKNEEGDVNDRYYPICIWDGKKGEVKSKCEKVSKVHSLKGKHEYLVGCGYCENLLF